MTIGALFEVAMVVDSMDRAMREELAALDPVAPSVSRVVLRTPHGQQELDLNITYTRTGPMRLEVIEQIPGTMFAELGVQHFGWFSDDLAGDSAALEARGMPLLATRDGEDGTPFQFVYHDCPPLGVVELVDVAMRPFLEDWWARGTASPGVHSRSMIGLGGPA